MDCHRYCWIKVQLAPHICVLNEYLWNCVQAWTKFELQHSRFVRSVHTAITTMFFGIFSMASVSSCCKCHPRINFYFGGYPTAITVCQIKKENTLNITTRSHLAATKRPCRTNYKTKCKLQYQNYCMDNLISSKATRLYRKTTCNLQHYCTDNLITHLHRKTTCHLQTQNHWRYIVT
jgi:hypothetical protein